MIPGLLDFAGEAIHSSRYSGKNVLVVGCGNSGMEIAYELASHGANTSIIVPSPVCVLFLLHLRAQMQLEFNYVTNFLI